MAAQVILVHLVHVRVVVSQHKGRFGTNSFETPFFCIGLFFILTAGLVSLLTARISAM